MKTENLVTGNDILTLVLNTFIQSTTEEERRVVKFAYMEHAFSERNGIRIGYIRKGLNIGHDTTATLLYRLTRKGIFDTHIRVTGPTSYYPEYYIAEAYMKIIPHYLNNENGQWSPYLELTINNPENNTL